jgi:hypothetical protein
VRQGARAVGAPSGARDYQEHFVTRRKRSFRPHRKGPAPRNPTYTDQGVDQWHHPLPERERSWSARLTDGSTYEVQLSKTRPAHYCLLLYGPSRDPSDPEARGELRAVFDNSHAPDEHHYHPVVDGKKQQPPEVFPASSPQNAFQQAIERCKRMTGL